MTPRGSLASRNSRSNSFVTVSSSTLSQSGVGSAAGLEVDVRDEASVRSSFDAACVAYGGVDVVVPNAGIALVSPVEELYGALTFYRYIRLAQTLGGFPGKKAVVLFSGMQDVPLDLQFADMAALAASSRCFVYPVDAAGLRSYDSGAFSGGAALAPGGG